MRKCKWQHDNLSFYSIVSTNPEGHRCALHARSRLYTCVVLIDLRPISVLVPRLLRRQLAQHVNRSAIGIIALHSSQLLLLEPVTVACLQSAHNSARHQSSRTVDGAALWRRVWVCVWVGCWMTGYKYSFVYSTHALVVQLLLPLLYYVRYEHRYTNTQTYRTIRLMVAVCATLLICYMHVLAFVGYPPHAATLIANDLWTAILRHNTGRMYEGCSRNHISFKVCDVFDGAIFIFLTILNDFNELLRILESLVDVYLNELGETNYKQSIDVIEHRCVKYTLVK